jgi:SAM-dependent methyltransferase
MSYQPREFWQDRLSQHFDLRGSGETGLSMAYNRACYALRAEVLTRALRDLGFDPRGREVLDVGCGTGFFTAYYLERGAKVSGIDIAPVSIEALRARHPQARFQLVDVGEAPIPMPKEGRYALVNAMDVLYHITDDARWETAVTHLAQAVEDQGLLILSDSFSPMEHLAEHNVMRPLSRYRALLNATGLQLAGLHATHVLLNRPLGPFRFLNRVPGLLLHADRTLLALGLGRGPDHNKMLVARRVKSG